MAFRKSQLSYTAAVTDLSVLKRHKVSGFFFFFLSWNLNGGVCLCGGAGIESEQTLYLKGQGQSCSSGVQFLLSVL